MSYYDRLIQKGEEKGRAEGEAKSRAEGRRAVVLAQLALKFGALGDDARARVEGASLEELDRMAERILTADHLADVLD